MPIGLRWTTHVRSSIEFRNGRHMLDSLGIDYEPGVTDEQAVTMLHAELDRRGSLLGDILLELTFDADFDAEIDADGATAEVYPQP